MNIPGFETLDQLGEGPMSTVWKAHQISLNRIVAIKVLKQKFTVKPNEVHPVLKEARAAAALKHPNIIPIYDAGELDGTFYFVMEYVAGSTIGQLIEKNGVISQKSTLNAALLIVDALDHAWKTANIVHRGINPDNIMIDADGTVKIADLGLAKLADPANLAVRLREGTVQGKLNYISPEQAKCSIRIDFRTDMYGLGATLYHMVTGQMPFKGLDPKEVLNQHLTGFLKNPHDIGKASVSIGMAQLISKLMMKDYKARYADWSEVLTTIKKIAAGKAKIAKPPEPATDDAEAPTSTIVPAKTPAPAKRSASSSSLSAPDPDAPPPLEIPWYIGAPVWVLFLSWWVFLAWSQLRLPPLRFAATPNTPPPAARAPATQPSKPTPAQPQALAPAPKAPVGPTSAESEEKQNELAFKTSVADRICAGEMDRAFTMVEQELEYPHSKEFTEDFRKLHEILRESRRVVEFALLKKLGQEIVVKDKGQSRRVTIRGMAGNNLSVDYTEKMGSAQVVHSLAIPIVKMDTAELIRCIGDDDSPSKSLTKYSLYMKNGEYHAAKKTAANCGPLADVLTQMAEAKQQGNGR